MRVVCFYIRVFVFILIFPQSDYAQVAIRDTSIFWEHHYYKLNSDYSLRTYSRKTSDIVVEKFTAKVIENEYYKLIIVPGFGGRIISYLYKPNNHEFLYRNPVGTPYLIGKNIFYYDWLMLWGGIFPTFPEPEHGKTWCRPWLLQVEKNLSDTAVISMAIADDMFYVGRPYNYQSGYTGIECKVEILVVAGQISFAYKVSLYNPCLSGKSYEYWTNTAMAPGSDPKNPAATLNSEMIVPSETVEAAYNLNSWQGIMKLDRVNFLSKWPREGIIYAIPGLNGNYWGIINHDNEEGMFRIADNRKHTIGLKIWTWGKNSVNADPYSFDNGGNCPIIELWAGVSRKFWLKAYLPARQKKNWTEWYYPTIGLANISGINNHAALDIKTECKNDLTVLKVGLMLTKPDKEYTLSVSLHGDSAIYPKIFDEKFVANPLDNRFLDTLAHLKYKLGKYTATYTIHDQENNLILSGSNPIYIGNPPLISSFKEDVHIYAIGNKKLRITSLNLAEKNTILYDLAGKVLVRKKFISRDFALQLPKSGMYILKITGSKGSLVQKQYVY